MSRRPNDYAALQTLSRQITNNDKRFGSEQIIPVMFSRCLLGLRDQALLTPDSFTSSGQLKTQYTQSVTGISIFVDAVLGTDTRTNLSKYDENKPFLTMTAALSAAVSGDTLIMRPGNYNEMLTLKTGVNLHFMEGATMIRTQTANGQILMKDNGVAVTCSITGRGVFSISGGSDGRILSLQAASSVTWELKSATNSTAGFNFISLQDTAASSLFITGDSVTTSGGAYGIYATAGSSTIVNLKNLTGPQPFELAGTATKGWVFLQNGLCNGTLGNSLMHIGGSSELYVQANYIKTTGIETLALTTATSTAIACVDINRIESTGAGGEGLSCSFGQLYGRVGHIICSGAVHTDNVPPAAVYIGLFVPTSACALTIGRIQCPNGYGFWIEEGVSQIRVESCEADIPISIRDGTVIASGYYKCTTASKPAVEFVRSGATGTLIMNGGILEAGASSTYSVTTVGSGSLVATISSYGTKINKPINTANITSSPRFIYNENNDLYLSGGIVGTATNDSASAGNVGQIISSAVAVGSAVSLTSPTAANVTSISLTAGDWDVEGNVNYNQDSATVTVKGAGISTTSATLPTDGTEVNSGAVLTTTTAIDGATLPRKRISLAATTTVYLVGQATFSAGTVAVYGSITARRVR